MEKLYILPFDHRGSFMKIVKAQNPPAEADIAKCREYKEIIYDALKTSVAEGVNKAYAGILVDEWLGKEILLDARKNGFITCTPLEKSGQDEFDFDRPDYKSQLDELKPTYAKVLVRYNPEGGKEINARQAKRLADLSSYLKTTPYKFLFELLVPATDGQLQKAGTKEEYERNLRPKLTVLAIKELQNAGVDPVIWKLEGLDTEADMDAVAKQVRAGNKNAGIIILGRGESKEKAEFWLRTCASSDAAIGFAVGRTVFQQPLEELRDGKIDRDAAVRKIADNYKFFVEVWEKVKGK